MYQSIYFDRKENLYHLWDDTEGYVSFERDSEFFRLAKDPKEETELKYLFSDHPVVTSKTYNGNSDDYLQVDLSPDIDQLIKLYNFSDDVSTNIKTVIVDIEVEMVSGQLITEEANNYITSIALYDQTSDIYYVFVVSEHKHSYDKEANVIVTSYNNDVNLLKAFINKMSEISPHIILGWNSDNFDIRYLYFRIKNILGYNWVKKLSPIGIVKYSERNKYVDIAGLASLDYMIVYKNYNYSELPSYKLDYVSKHELGHGKIDYEGSLDTLFREDIEKFIEYNLVDVKLIKELDAKLDFVELTRRICHISHIPYQQFKHSSSVIEGAIMSYMDRKSIIAPNKKPRMNITSNKAHTIGLNELHVDCDAVRHRIPTNGLLKVFRVKKADVYEYHNYEDGVFYLNKHITKPFKENVEIKLAFEGAYVRLPETNIYEWLFSIDLQSLYPSIIITLNISPETKAGKILNWEEVNLMKYISRFVDGDVDFDKINYDFGYINDDTILRLENLNKEVFEVTKDEFIEFILENKYTIASNGMMYSTDKIGLIPEILSDWFDKRLDYKDKMKSCRKDGDYDMERYYDKLQLVQKILLNSIYGVLGLETFRFYDLENASAVTSTGRDIIKYASYVFNKLYSVKHDLPFDDVIIYNDTDSSYLPFHPSEYKEEDLDKLSDIAEDYCNSINDSLEIFSKSALHSNNNRLKFNREKITRRGLWLGKKRYAQYVVDSEGKRDLANPIDFKGIEVVRSSFPVKFQDHLSTLLNIMLIENDKPKCDKLIIDLMNSITADDLEYISKISSVKTLDQYDDPELDKTIYVFQKGATAPVKAALGYNRLLKFFDADFKYQAIKQGDKIKYVYLKHNPFNLSIIGYPMETPYPKIMEFIKTYINIEKIYDSELSNKLSAIYDTANWRLPTDNVNCNDFY